MKNTPGFRMFMGTIVIVVVAVAIVGLWVSGSPAAERAARLDDRRIQDLQSISNGIDNYFNLTGSRLPPTLQTLAAMRDSYYVSSILDPETGLPYEYLIDTTSTYRLCAKFATNTLNQQSDPNHPYPYYSSTFWEHGPERTCYNITARIYPK